MQYSLKRYLTINALIIVVLSTFVAMSATFFLRHESARKHMDAELSLEAHLIESLMVKRLSPRKIKRIQDKISDLPTSYHHDDSSQDAILQALSHRSQFQIWDLANNRLIIHTPNAPSIPLNANFGYQAVYYNNSLWRSYSIELPKLNYKVVTLQRHDRKLNYEKQFISDTLMVLCLSFSFLIFSLGLIMQRGLSVLDHTKAELSEREPENLNPIDSSNAPLEVKPLIEEINRLMTQLKAALQREHEFAANAAHELKTPLSTMKAQIQVALMQPPEKQASAFKCVESSIERYDHIIRQLLTLSRTISHASLEIPKPISLVPLAQNTIATLVPLALTKEISLELQHEINPILNINSILISTALQNLIDNAIKYSNPKDTVIVRIYENDNNICIDVIDHGKGIMDIDKKTALERFKRLNNSSQGSGLGLSIVSEICKQMNGKLFLSDTPNGGLTATITLLEDSEWI